MSDPHDLSVISEADRAAALETMRIALALVDNDQA